MPGRFLQFSVISEGAEYLVMGYLMRRNILTYKAPPGNEGYDLICIHPDPRHQLATGELAQVRVQVKSRHRTSARSSGPRRKARPPILRARARASFKARRTRAAALPRPV